MMIRKYKIGNFTAEVRAASVFQDVEPFSLFLYDGETTDYTVNIEFSANLPPKSGEPYYVSPDRESVCENGAFACFFKSRDSEDEFYACRIDDGNNVDIIIDEKYSHLLRTDVIFTLIGIEEIVAESDGCVLHSSFIEKDGEAILFTGPCDIGKSTQANLWREYADAVVVNGDKTLIFEENGAFYASGMPFSGSSKDCMNKVLPIKAIVSLKQAEYNDANKLVSSDAFYNLYKNCYPVHHSRELTGKLIDFVQKLSQSVPVYEYDCLADESAVRYLERKLCPFLQSH